MKQLFLYVLLFVVSVSNAQIGGIGVYKFLNLPFSARTASLGGNLISVFDDDLNLVAQNPSLLNSSMSNKIALNYINYFSDINYGYSSYARHFDKIGTFAAGIQFTDYGKFIAADENGDITGNFKASDYCLNLTYARELDTNFSVGGHLKTIYSTFESYYSVGNAIDVSATYHKANRNFVAAIVIKNIGYQWHSYNKGVNEQLPFEIQLGISKKPKHAPFRVSVLFANLQKWNLTYSDPQNPVLTVDPLTNTPIKEKKLANFTDKFMRHLVFGGELLLTKNFNIRIGYNYMRRKELHLETRPGMVGFSFGFGIKISKFQISYGRASYHLAGASNHFTVSCNLSEFYKKENK